MRTYSKHAYVSDVDPALFKSMIKSVGRVSTSSERITYSVVVLINLFDRRAIVMKAGSSHVVVLRHLENFRQVQRG